jgi:signal transduction histidine kinase/DNA-binding response OmpR family regulator
MDDKEHPSENSGHRILIIDDDEAICRSLMLIFETQGYEAETAGTGREALEKARGGGFNVALLDIRLPDMEGTELLTPLKETTPDMAVILVTGYASLESAVQALNEGASAYITKPLNLDEVMANVREAFEKQQLLREKRQAEEALRQRNYELALLHRASQMLASTLDLDQVLTTIVGEVYLLLNVVSCSVWLIDQKTHELVCRQAAGSRSEVVRGWRLAPGQGIAGGVSRSGESLVVPDTRVDKRHFKGVQQTTGVELRSILCVPLLLKEEVIGVLEVLDKEVDRFRPAHLRVAEALAASAAIAVQNARLFDSAQRELAERRRAEEALKEYSERLEEMVEQRTKELRDAQEQLIHAERLAAIGQLGASVGHELRNPLGVIKNSTYYINMKLGDADEKVKKHLKIMEREIATSNKIINDLLSFARDRKPTLQRTQINTVVEDALSRTAVPDEVAVITELEEYLPSLMADSDQIGQVFINLILNAAQAMSTGGKLEIATKAENGFIVTEFKDNGCGIPDENLRRLFEPLFTTKAKGIGLGLAVSKQLIEAHEGTIEVESQVGKGTTFRVKLPMSSG